MGVPMVPSFVGVAEPAMLGWAFSLSVMVDVDGEREKVLAKGPRWVSLSFFVSFHDMLEIGISRMRDEQTGDGRGRREEGATVGDGDFF